MSYISYCWSFGTTSFRTREFNKKIEEQLSLIKQFWSIPMYSDKEWTSNAMLQKQYYEFLKKHNFVAGNAPRPDKDAREKTSGLVDLGFLDEHRHLTDAGESLLNCLSNTNDSGSTLNVSNDSYIYLKQMLKVSFHFQDEYVRPLPIVAMILNKYDYITKDEMTFLIPLITSKNKMNMILEKICEIRNGTSTIDDTIISILLSYPNYSTGLSKFLKSQSVTLNLIKEIGMNRKNGKYDEPYLGLYQALQLFLKDKGSKNGRTLITAINKISGSAKKYWLQDLVIKDSAGQRDSSKWSINTNSKIFNCSTEKEFKKAFFCMLHLNKAKSLLSDYFDLNCRYFKTTNVLLFEDEKIKFDVFPKHYFKLIKDNLSDIAFDKSDYLQNDVDISKIVNNDIKLKNVIDDVRLSYGSAIKTPDELRAQLNNERYERLKRLIENKFSNQQLIHLLGLFEQRDDVAIQDYVTNNADAPTLFEYIIGIIWYKISGYSGDVLSYMNLSLDSDLLPITHASGGREDITYEYSTNDGFSRNHTCLLEVTLSNENQQRRMELEPVSRHLGEYKLNHPNQPTYCIFISNYLDINVINDFRNRFTASYYSTDGSRKANSLMIVPIQTSELKTIIGNEICYEDICRLCYDAYNDPAASSLDPMAWYHDYIVQKINNLVETL